MKTKIRVENHNPVPLRPVADLVDEIVRSRKSEYVVYLDRIMWENGEIITDAGWYIWQAGGHWTSVEADNDFWNDFFSYKNSTGRLLQPGEKLIVEFEQ